MLRFSLPRSITRQISRVCVCVHGVSMAFGLASIKIANVPWKCSITLSAKEHRNGLVVCFFHLKLVVFDSKMQRTLKEVKLFVFPWDNIVSKSFQFWSYVTTMCKLDGERQRRRWQKKERLCWIFSNIQTHTYIPIYVIFKQSSFWIDVFGIMVCNGIHWSLISSSSKLTCNEKAR